MGSLRLSARSSSMFGLGLFIILPTMAFRAVEEAGVNLFKLWLDASLEQQGVTVACLRAMTHRQADQDATVEGALHILAASTCKSDPVIIILNVHGSFLPIHCYNIICVTKIQ